MKYQWDLCPMCGNVTAANWTVRHMKSGCQSGHHTHQELNIICNLSGCENKVVYGGRINSPIAISGIFCERHRNELRDPKLLFP